MIAFGVATVTIRRGDKLNALNLALWRQLADVFRSLSADSKVGCVLLTAEGGRAFCVGADITEFAALRNSSATARIYGDELARVWREVKACPHPVIALIDGQCLGGGLILACCADLRIATLTSVFGVPAKNLGTVLDYPQISPMLRILGPSQTLSLLLTGNSIGAAEALRIGLINAAVPAADLAMTAGAMGRSMTRGSALIARQQKKAVWRLLELDAITEEEKRACFDCFDTDDYRRACETFASRTHDGRA